MDIITLHLFFHSQASRRLQSEQTADLHFREEQTHALLFILYGLADLINYYLNQ